MFGNAVPSDMANNLTLMKLAKAEPAGPRIIVAAGGPGIVVLPLSQERKPS